MASRWRDERALVRGAQDGSRAALERIEIPGAGEVEERARLVLGTAFDEHHPERRSARRSRRPLIAAVAVLAIVAGALSPPGRALVDTVRRTLGIDHARPALFSLPARGRLLVHSDDGLWIASADGSRRFLGRYEMGSWSPLGRYVVAARANELAALDARGGIRWTLARPHVLFPRWSGDAVDTRIAYLSASRLHVVAGDGTGDVDAGGLAAAAPVAPAWQGGFGFAVAYADTRGRVSSFLTSKGALLWRAAPLAGIRSLESSTDAKQLLVLADDAVEVIDASNGKVVRRRGAPGVVAAAFRPGSHAIATLHDGAAGSRVLLGGRTLFSFAGELRGLTWSPDGRWLLVGSPASDQWVFVRADGRRIVAVSNVSAQFHSRSFPRVEGWCCGT